MSSFRYNVRSTPPSYEYRAPLIYVELIAELDTVDTPPLKDPARLEARHSDWALSNTMSKYGKGFTSHTVTAWRNKGPIPYLDALLLKRITPARNYVTVLIYFFAGNDL